MRGRAGQWSTELTSPHTSCCGILKERKIAKYFPLLSGDNYDLFNFFPS
jgi:hypothetical protein